MNVECQTCGKSFELPDDRLPAGKKVSFPCPGCKSKITLDLRLPPASAVPSADETGGSAEPAAAEPSAPSAAAAANESELQKKILRRINDLPPMPKIIAKAREIMDNPRSGFKEIAEVIEADQAIAAKVLQVANSAYYGLSGMVASIHQATVVLGHKTLEQLITMVSASSLLGSRLKGYRLGAGTLWQHSLAVALCSRLIAKDRAPALESDAFSVGLIHDAGKLALDRYLFEQSSQMDDVLQTGVTFLEAEKLVLGFDHTELAAGLCTKWNLPESHANAVRYHHDPAASDGNPLAYIVYIANHIARQTGIGGDMGGDRRELDPQTMSFLALDEDDLAAYDQATRAAVNQITQSMA